MMSLFIGEFARTGWLSYAPLAELAYSPDIGVDYYLWSLEIAGVDATLSAINMVATILKMRAPGRMMMKMPVFCWTELCSNVRAVAIFPTLTAAFFLLLLDRYVDTNFFTNEGGSSPMMYWNLVWIWSHPEVYVLILPAFGIYSEITSTFTGKLLLAVPPTDFVLHNSLFLVAHFHNVIIGGVVFGMLAGITY